MSTGKNKRGYQFTVQGKYYADNDSGKPTLRFYKKLTFILPEISTYVIGKKWEYYTDERDPKVEKKRSVPNVKRQNTLKCFKYMIKNYYLDTKLSEEYPDYIRFQTFQVTSRSEVQLTPKMMKNFSVNGPIESMSESQLIMFVAFKDLNVDLKNYFDLADKKIAVEMALADSISDIPGVDRPMTSDEMDLLPPENVKVTVIDDADEEVETIDAFI